MSIITVTINKGGGGEGETHACEVKPRSETPIQAKKEGALTRSSSFLGGGFVEEDLKESLVDLVDPARICRLGIPSCELQHSLQTQNHTVTQTCKQPSPPPLPLSSSAKVPTAQIISMIVSWCFELSRLYQSISSPLCAQVI